MKIDKKLIFCVLIMIFAIASVFAAADIRQNHYRWRNDDGDEPSATWLANEDTGITLNSAEINIRLRMEIYNCSQDTEGTLENMRLQYNKDNSVWIDITNDGTTNDFKLSLTDHYEDGNQTITDLLTDTYNQFNIMGLMIESTEVHSFEFMMQGTFEFEWCLQATQNASDGNYQFRVYDEADFYTSDLSAELTFVGGEPILPPENLTVEEDTGLFTWDSPASGEPIGYDVYLDTEFLENATETEFQFEELTYGQTYTAGVSAVYDSGTSEIIEIEFIYGGTGAGDDIVLKNKLIGNYPNPFNPSTTISFNLTTEDAKNAKIEIYNLKGQKVKTLVSGQFTAGKHSVVWNGTDNSGNSASSGMYFIKMKTANETISRKIMLLK